MPSFWMSGVVAGVTSAMDEQVAFRSDVTSHGMKSTLVDTWSPVPPPTLDGPVASPHQLHSPSATADRPTARKPTPLPVMLLLLLWPLYELASPRSKPGVLWALDTWPAWVWMPTSLPVSVFLVTVWLVPSTTMPKPSPVEPTACPVEAGDGVAGHDHT